MKDCGKGLPWAVQNLTNQVLILIKKKGSDEVSHRAASRFGGEKSKCSSK